MSQSDEQDASTDGLPDAGETKEHKSKEQTAPEAIDKDDPHKVEKLSKLGHADDEAAKGTE